MFMICFSSRRFVSGDEQAETLFDDLVKYATTSIDHRTALGGNAPVSIMRSCESIINRKAHFMYFLFNRTI